MSAPFAIVADVVDVWGELSVAEETKVQAWLDVASTNLRLLGRKRGVDIDQYIDGDPLLIEAAKNAVVAAVTRRLMNPTGVRQRAKTTGAGPYTETESETIDSSISSGGLYFTDTDVSWLPAARRVIRSFRVRTGFR